MGKVDILIDNGFVAVRHNNKLSIIENGAVAIEGNRILEVGSSAELKRKYQALKLIDARDKLVMPGFINNHSHLCSGLRRGLMDDLAEAVPWLRKLFTWWYPMLNEELYYYGAMITLIEQIKSGITTMCDCTTMPGLEATAVRAVDEIGFRAVLGRITWDLFGEHTISGFPPHMQETTEQNLVRGEEFIKRYHHTCNNRILAWLCNLQVPNVSAELWKRSKELIDKHGSGLLTHLSVSRAMTDLTIAQFGLPDVEWLGSLGVLGPHLVGAHASCLTGKELILLKETKTNVVHCPGSTMKGAYGSISHGLFPEMYSMGINLCLATDSPASSNSMDMLRQLYLAATAHKEARLDPALLPSGVVLDWATINAARAIGMEDQLGSIEAGKKADIAIFNLLTTGWVPFSKENLLGNMVYSASGTTCDTTIIDGKIVMENKEIRTVDEEKVIRECQKLFKNLVKKAEWLQG